MPTPSRAAAGALPGGRRRRSVVLADYVGLSAAEAIEAARTAGLRPAPERVESGEPGHHGLVIAQEPVAGSPAPRDGVVVFSVADAAEAAAVDAANGAEAAEVSEAVVPAAVALELATPPEAVATADAAPVEASAHGSSATPAGAIDTDDTTDPAGVAAEPEPAFEEDFLAAELGDGPSFAEEEPLFERPANDLPGRDPAPRRLRARRSPGRWIAVAALGVGVFAAAVLVQQRPAEQVRRAPAVRPRDGAERVRPWRPQRRERAERRVHRLRPQSRPRASRRRARGRHGRAAVLQARVPMAPARRPSPRPPDPRAAEFF